MGSVHDIKWGANNLKDSDHLIIQYSRDGGAGWFRIAQDIPALSFSYSWHVDNFPTTQGRVKILLQGNRSITDQSDANFTVQRSHISRSSGRTAENRGRSGSTKTSTGADKTPAATPSTLITAPTTAPRG